MEYEIDRRDFLKITSKGAFILMMSPLANRREQTFAYEPAHLPPNNINERVELLKAFTSTYQKFSNANIEHREAECLKIQWKSMVCDLQENDLFAGRMGHPAIGFSPQAPDGKFGYYLLDDEIAEILEHPDLSQKNKEKLQELIHFWDEENTISKCKAAFPDEMQEALPSDDYFNESGIAFTLWRMSGSQLDYGKLIELGIPGLKKRIKNKSKSSNKKSQKLYNAMLIALDILADVCIYYAAMAKRRINKTNSSKRRTELLKLEKCLRNIAKSRPETFYEGLQLMYLYNNLSGSLNYGRIDDYLGDLYVKDIAEGRLTKEEAIELLSSLWQIMEDRGWRYDQRMIIGGKGRKNEANADRLAMAIMETSRRVKGIVPQLAFRFYNEQNPELYQKALDVLGEGYTYPMLYNDDVNIPAVMEAFEVPQEEAIHAIQFGCGEYILNHRSFGTPSGVINLLQALLVTLHKGIDPVTGEPMGLPQKEFDKYNDFASFDALYNAYKEQVEYHVEQLALHEELEYDYAAKGAPYLYFSMLYDDCIEEGEAIFSGGVRYLGGTLESYGNTNAADSLVAIRELVYEKEIFTLDEIIKMIDANFAGYQKERKMMLNCPKYGNDNSVADQMLVEIDRHVCEYTRKQKENTILHSYLIVIINNDANVVMGGNTPASPDGRKAFNYMNNGNAPMSGMDQNGVTAFLNSIVKPDSTIHAGAVQNMKFSREMFTKYRDKLEILLKTYWEKGGTQAMLTVIGREDLKNAMENPEDYQHLVVRVGGFAERFVDLPRETQEEILERTLY